MTKEELLLRVIFEGPIRPLTEEDQRQQDLADARYQEAIQNRNVRCANILGITVEEVEEMRTRNPRELIERVALRRMPMTLNDENDPLGIRRLKRVIASNLL